MTTRTNLPITRVLVTCILLVASGGLRVSEALGDDPAQKHTVTPSAGPNGTIDPDCATEVAPGSDVELTAAADPGYQVDVWSVDGAEAQTGGTNLTLTDIQADHTVHVTFRLLEYEVTSSAGPNGTISPEGVTVVTHGSDLAFTATPGADYKVDEWSVDGAKVQSGGTGFTLTDVQADKTVEVTFKLLEFKVTSSAGPGGIVSPEGHSVVTIGSDLELTAAPDEGYQVDKWSVDGAEAQAGGTSFTLSDIRANHTVDVTFKLLEFEVTSAAGPNGTVSPDGVTVVTYGSNLELTATPDTGYQVDKWSVDGVEAQTGGDSFTLTDVKADHTADVTFRLLEFEITASAGDNGAVSPDGVTTVTYGSGLELTATPDTGYQVDKWCVDGVEAQVGGTVFGLTDIQADHTVKVTFRLLEFDITSAAGPNGTVSPDGVTVVTYGSDLELTADPNTGHQVDMWLVDGVEAQIGGDSLTLTDIQADHTVDVTFRLLEFDITTSADPNGAVEPNGVTVVTYGSELDITAIPNEGYQVDKWIVDGNDVQTGNNLFKLTDIKADHSVEVTFRLLEFDITGIAGENGEIDPNGVTTLTYGSDLEFTAAPEGEYLVRIWSVDGVQVQIGGTEYTLADIKADHTVEVSFSLLFYVITPEAGPNGSISPGFPVTAEPNDSLDFTATPDDEYLVRAWFVDGILVQAEGTSYTLGDIQSEHTVSVAFVQVRHTVDATAGPGGSVSPQSADVPTAGSQIFTATADAGYEVDTWTLDGVQVQTGGTTYELSSIRSGQAVHVTFKRLPTYSLGIFEFEDEQETKAGIVNNNSEPDQILVFVEPLGVGSDPDNSVLCLRNLKDGDGQTVNPRAKATFSETDADEVLIRFKYLFASSTAKLVVYVSDSPQLLAPDDPERPQHYVEVARLAAPPFDRPGSEGSDRLGVFEELVETGALDLSGGLYVELELIDQTDGGSVCVDSWSSQVLCHGNCFDINGDNSVDEADFLKVLTFSGLAAEGETAGLEGVFGADGYMDSYDVASWDWAMNSDRRLLGYCGLPLAGDPGSKIAMSAVVQEPDGAAAPMVFSGAPGILSDLLIAGKRGSADAADKLKGSLYVFDAAGEPVRTFEPASNRCNIRLVKGPDGQIYQLNSETGLLRLDGTNEVVVPPGQIELAGDPRSGETAMVYVGIQGEGSDAFGRPILDVAFDADYVYVVPVVVDPDGGEPYTAAAKLRLTALGDAPYELVELYDDAPPANDNQRRNNLRELELDRDGNLYVLNVNSLNESDILLKYSPDGTVERLNLGRPDGGSYVPAPVAMLVSQADGALYLTSAVNSQVDPASTVVYKLSTENGLALEKSVTIDGMQHITGMTEDPATGTLWVAGFNMYDVPQDPDPTRPAFYMPCVASISDIDDSVQIIPLFAPASHDLALPMSILWTGAAEQSPVL